MANSVHLKYRSKIRSALVFICVISVYLLIPACDNPVVDPLPPDAQNSAPVADAGTNIQVLLTGTANLDGSASSDPDGDPLTFTWSLTSAPGGSTLDSADIVNADTDSAQFTPDVAGTYSFELNVSDGELSDTDSVNVEAVVAPADTIAEWPLTFPLSSGSLFGTAVFADGNHSNATAFRSSILFDGATGGFKDDFSDLSPGTPGTEYQTSISYWMKADYSVADLDYQVSINANSANGELHIGMQGGNIVAESGADSVVLLNNYGSTLTANVWVHVIVTWDTSTGAVELFLDGNSAGTASLSRTNFNIAQINFGSKQGSSTSFTGYLDDVRIYDRILTSTEITALHAD